MALEVFYAQDIHNALLAAQQANDAAFEAVAVTDDNTAAFRRGYHAALTTLALAFGIAETESGERPCNCWDSPDGKFHLICERHITPH